MMYQKGQITQEMKEDMYFDNKVIGIINRWYKTIKI